jgi:ABC-type phosphate transport system substrate-binding protein
MSLVSFACPADVVAVVSAQSPITVLTQGEVADLFLGKATHFPNGLHAEPIDQLEDSAVRNEFYEKVAGKSPAQIKAIWSRIIFTGRGQPPPTVAGNREMKKALTARPSAIGYIDRDMVDDSVRIVF